MGRRCLALFLTVFLLLCGIPTSYATETGAQITICGSADGTEFTIEIRDAVFNVVALTLLYDTAQLRPAGGFEATVARAEQADWLALIDKRLEPDVGLLNLTAYVSPGYGGTDGFDADGQAVVGADAVLLFTLRFERIADTGSPVLQLAAEEGGGTYDPLNPHGAALLSAGVSVPFDLSIQLAHGEDTGEDTQTYTLRGNRTAVQQMTRSERVKGTILMPIGGAHCVAEGVRVPIYAGEPDVTCYAKNNRVFVPIRFVAEYLGAEVLWNNEAQTVTVRKGERTVVMQVGSGVYTIDGAEHEMDVPAEFSGREGDSYRRTMVPIRFTAEALDVDVQWDSANNMVILSPGGVPWDGSRSAERELMRDATVLSSPLLNPFVS